MEPVCHGDDLCTLQELSDSTILSCLESRYNKNIHHAHIGQTVSLYLSPSPQTIPPHANRLAAAVLSDLCTQADDQCLLLYGSKPEHKTTVYQSVLASLLSQTRSNLTNLQMAAVQLLSLLTNCDGVLECVLATSLFVNPATRKSTGAHFSCMLLNTTNLQKFKAFTRLDLVGEKLEEVGVPLQLRDNYMALMNAVRLLLEGEEAGGYLGVQLCTDSGQVLAQQLYAYLVAWTVSWLNSELAPPPNETPHRVLCVSHPSKWTDSYHDSLPDLVTRYCSESLYNLFCQRLFVWEQEQYTEEGIEWENVPVELNETLMDTFHKADGLLYSVGLDSSERVMAALSSCCESSGDTCYETDSDTFVVTHFTGEQSYVLTNNWPTLNRLHSVSHDLTHLLSTSSNQLLQEISKIMMDSSPDVLPIDHTPSDHTHSLTSRARECMHAVCEEVTTCHPHFVLTLSVNNGQEDKGVSFDPTHVLTQLQHLRVLDVALIQSCGYPVRMSHDKFMTSYSSLLISEDPAQLPRDMCRALVEAVQLEDCVVGSHQVLLKPWHVHQLEDALSVFQTSARKLQQAFRRSYSRRNSDRMKMEKAFSIIRQPNVFEDSGEDECDGSPPSSITSPTRHVMSPDSHTSEFDEPLTSSGDMEYPTSTIPPNVPASRPHPSLPACPHLSPPQKSPSRASPASPKSPAKSGHARAKKRSWGKDIRFSSSQASAAPSLVQEDHTSYSWYHGMISRSDAERALRSVNCDCFLIRESQNRGGEHSLTLTHKGKVKHFRIDTKPGSKIRYELYGAKRSFLRLSELVEYYSQYCLSADGELLVTPYPKDGTFEDCPPPLPPPRKTNLSSIRRPQQSIRKLHNRPKPVKRSVTEQSLNQGTAHPPIGGTRPQSVDLFTADISDESILLLQKELDIEERIMEAARRLADMPCNKRERQRRKQSLVEVRSRLLMLRQQYHTVQERRRFIELSMQNITSPTRRTSEPLPPLPPPRGSNRSV